VVECDLAKVEVAGSTPVSRSMIFLAVAPRSGELYAHRASTSGALTFRARYPSGKGEVCKTFMRRFDSDPRLQHLVKTFLYLSETNLITRGEQPGEDQRGLAIIEASIRSLSADGKT
jgi:hypothetical protein